MIYKTNWLAGLLGPLLVSTAALAVQSNMVTSNTTTLMIDNGAVHGIGQNQFGIINQDSVPSYSSPFFTGKLKAKSVALTAQRSSVLYENGTADFSGYSYTKYAALPAQNIPASNITDVALTINVVYYISDGKVFSWTGEQNAIPVEVPGGSNAAQIAAGNYHLVVLFNDGSVGTMGRNDMGQLGNGSTGTVATTSITKLPDVQGAAIQAAQSASYVVKSDGTVLGFGRNNSKQLANIAGNVLVPTQIQGLSSVKKIMAVDNATFALRQDGSLMACGWHNYIGDSLYNTNPTCVQMPVGTSEDISSGNGGRVLLNKGKVGQREGWGGNLYCSLGDGSCVEQHSLVTMFFTPILPPVEAPAPTPTPEPVVAAPTPTPTDDKGPATTEPVPTDTAIAMPFPETPSTTEPTPPTVIETVVGVIAEVVNTVVEAVNTVIDTVIAIVTPTPADEVKSTTPPTTTPVVDSKIKCNNGFGNGDQCAPGNSLMNNNAENAQNTKGNAKTPAPVVAAAPTKKK